MKRILFLLLLLFYAKGQGIAWGDSITFDKAASYCTVEVDSNSIWQVSTPGKTFFNSAHSGTKAILTDTTNSYPPNDTSYFYIVIPPQVALTSCWLGMQFFHKYDFASLSKGYIEASYDKGNSWFILEDTSFYWNYPSAPMEFRWEADVEESTGNTSIHPLYITGKSNGWIRSTFVWIWYPAVKTDSIIIPQDTLLVRFVFVSGPDTVNNEGWMIDDIIVGHDICSGISASKEPEVKIYPNPVSDVGFIELTNVSFPVVAEIYDTRGIKVKVMNIYSRRKAIDVKSLSGRIYLLVLRNPDGAIISRYKFLVE